MEDASRVEPAGISRRSTTDLLYGDFYIAPKSSMLSKNKVRLYEQIL